MSRPSPEEIHDFYLNCHGARKHGKPLIGTLIGLRKYLIFQLYNLVKLNLQ